MRIRVCSDLHLEFSPNFVLEPGYDDKTTTLILAGDIAPAIRIDRYGHFFLDVANRFANVIWVPGNHEFYQSSVTIGTRLIKEFVDRYNITVLNNEMINIQGVDILGTTLWTNFDNGDPLLLWEKVPGYADYYQIISKNGHQHIDNYEMHDMHQESFLFLKRYFDYKEHNQKCVVVTHMSPSYQGVTERFRYSRANHLFHSNLDRHIYEWQPIVWVHGHTHDSLEYKIGNTTVLCNPRGYHDENPNFINVLEVEF